MKVIFLDIDGVLNCQTAYENGYCEYIEKNDISYPQFYPPSKSFLNKLIEETGAKIVISSTWRHSGLDFMRKVWDGEGMSGEIIDITPTLRIHELSLPRGLEIDVWLEKHGFSHIFWSEEGQLEYIKKSGIENYLIIDDDSDMLYNQKDHFVHVLPSPRNMDGFKEKHYRKGLEILSKNIIELHKDKFYTENYSDD